MTFALSGFSTVKREGIELAGSFAATVNVDMKVGAVQETITVTGASPIVDVQNSAQQRVLGADVIDAIPTSRTQFTTAVLIPGMTISTAQDVGGTNSLAGTTTSLAIHGGRPGDQRILIDGLPTANAETTGNASNFLPNMGSTQEMTIDYAAGTAEQETGGVRVNMIPRQGGNQLSASLFGTAVNSSFQSNNFTDELKATGLRAPDTIKLNYDVNPSVGGPLMRDKLWFYSSARFVANQNYVAGIVGQQVRRQSEGLDLRAGRQRQGAVFADAGERQRPPDAAGEREEQVQRLLRQPVALLVQAHAGEHLAGVRQHLQLSDREPGIVLLVVAADQPPADRGQRVAPRRAVRGRQAAGG